MVRLAILLAILAVSTRGFAQPKSEKNLEAVRLGREALGAFQQGDWPGAFAGFQKAEALSHSPVFLLYMARARRNAGALLEARELYSRVAAEALDASAPAPWHSAVTDAAAELGEISRRIPSISIRVRPLQTGETVAVDERPIAAERLGGEIELDPGEHAVLLGGPRGAVARATVTLTESSRGVVVSLDAPPPPLPVVIPPPPPPARPKTPPKPEAPPSDRSKSDYGTLATVTGIVGLAGIAVGSIAGIAALSKTRTIKEHCDDDVCPTKYEDDAEVAKDYAAVSTVGFVVGGIGLGASATFLWILPSFSPAQGGYSGVTLRASY